MKIDWPSLVCVKDSKWYNVFLLASWSIRIKWQFMYTDKPTDRRGSTSQRCGSMFWCRWQQKVSLSQVLLGLICQWRCRHEPVIRDLYIYDPDSYLSELQSSWLILLKFD
jgi:hypothetical protein